MPEITMERPAGSWPSRPAAALCDPARASDRGPHVGCSRVAAVLSPARPVLLTSAGDRLIPGSCVVSDAVTLPLLVGRFSSSVSGWTIVNDGPGTDLALPPGLTPETGAANVPAAARLWRESFSHAQFLWLSYRFTHRIAFSTTLWQYMHSHFKQICTDGYGDELYRRTAAGSA
jgi:hypothetical protein